MRLLQHSIMACLLICILAGNENEENRGLGFFTKRGNHLSPRGQPARRTNSMAKNGGAQDGRRHRCTLKLQQSNCIGTHFIMRWSYSSEINSCESISFPLCWEKSGVFLTCTACMNTCLKEYKDGPEKEKDTKILPEKYEKTFGKT
uniref:Putative bovine pancreatic trypsin inhibitor n=1 Tax=Rhipicephalus microplus TaxID=6941 RepID=A0A6G5A562_RHIMP